MDFLKTSLEDWIRDWLAGMVYSGMEGMMSSVNSQTQNLGGLVSAQPSTWNPGIWQMITSIADAVILPIAVGILTYVMCVELIGWMQDKNNLHNSGDVVFKLISYVIKLGIGALLVYKASDITLWVFDLGAWAVSQAAGIQTDPNNLALSLQALKEQLKTMDIGELMGLTFTTLIAKIGMDALGITIRLIVTGRIIEIYIYCSVGSAPYATLTNSKLSGIGENYIKNLLALAFQGFFMFIMLGIYSVLMNEMILTIGSAGAWNATGMVFEMLFITITLVMMLLRSKAIAKSIFTAQ